MAADPHCIPCERYDNWIEIDVRDEHNQPFKGLKAILTDETGKSETVTLKDGPTLVRGFAVGPVDVKIETQPWLKAAQSREKLKEGEQSGVPAYTDKLSGHCNTKREHIKATTEDLCQSAPQTPLPEAHQKGKAGNVRFFTKHSYVIEVKGYQLNTLRIGVFFDGTGNNTRNAQAGLQKVEKWLLETCSDPAQREKELRACQMGQSPVEGSSANDVTNVWKLNDQYLFGAKTLSARAYISGIGTRDPVPGKDGSVVYRSDDTFTQGLDLDLGGENTSIIGKVMLACEVKIPEGIELDLGRVLPKIDCIHCIEIDVFGFSRGAAAARHFVNVIDQKADHPLVKAIANNPNIRLKEGFDWASRGDVRFTFVGLFDTVVSSYNSRVNINLKADCAKRVVHLTAHDEVRKHFPLSRITDIAGKNIPHDFTELALPGAHSDIGGGYYSRWSLGNPNSDPALTECVELERFMSIENVNIPDGASRAYFQAKAYAEEKQAMGWVERINPNLPRGAVPSLGAISLRPYSFRRPEGKNSSGPGKKSVYVEVLMNRVVEGEYSRIPLHMMVEAGLAVGVPFKAWKPEDRALQLESLSTKRSMLNLTELDRLWAQAATKQKNVENLASQLPAEDYHMLRRDYLHHSASNQGIANPARTDKYEPTISKERRELIGNKGG